MDYTEIKTLALSYMDEEGTEAIANMDNFLRVVESRINRELSVQEMVVESITPVIVGQSKYGLPSDFGGIRDIGTYTPPDGNITTLAYYSPEQMNNNTEGIPAYTIIADQFEVTPLNDGQNIQITYYKRIPPLTETADTNWISESNPDLYVFGLLVELASFKKDKESTNLWNTRFVETVASIINHDDTTRWSGTAMQIRLG